MTRNKLLTKPKSKAKQSDENTPQYQQQKKDMSREISDENYMNGNQEVERREYRNDREDEEEKEDRYLADISKENNRQCDYNHMYIDDPNIFLVGEVIDFQNLQGQWLDAVVVLKNKGNLKISSIKAGKREEEWLEKTSNRIVKQWKPNTRQQQQKFKVNQRLAILDREINENSLFITKDNYLEARVVESDYKLKEICVTYTPRLSLDYDEWILCSSQRIMPISYLQNVKRNEQHLNQQNLNHSNYNKKQLKKNARDYESQQVKEYKENILKKGLVLREMESDGNCLFRSVADQLYGDQSLHAQIRKYVMDYLVVEKEYFMNFICMISEENQKGNKKKKNKKNKNKAMKISSNEMQQDIEKEESEDEEESNSDIFDKYVKHMREDRTWGDDVEIQIISEIYKKGVEIYYAFEETPMRTFHENQEQFQGDLPIRLSYHGKCHYNSIKSINRNELISEKIGVVEEQAIRKAQERQSAIKFISSNKNQGDILLSDLQNLCRQKFEVFQNYSNTDELYQRLIQEQYESSTFSDNMNTNEVVGEHPNQAKLDNLYYNETFNLMNGGNSELALELALEESRYMMEHQLTQKDQNNENIKGDINSQMDTINNGNEHNEIKIDNQINNSQPPTNNDNNNLSQADLERIVVLNAVENIGFSREQAEIAIDIVGPNEDLVVNYILENYM